MKKLICFPCAGGNAKSFEKLSRGIHCFVIGAEYSGHWSRYEEPLYHSMEDCIQHQMQELREKVGLQDEIFLLGHSMGALIAFELGKNLLNAGYNVKELYLLACMPPDEINDTDFNFQDDEEIKLFLKRINQMPDSVLNSDFFRENLLPSIRNDLRILKNFIGAYSSREAIDCNIVCMCAVQDPLANEMCGWQRYSQKKIKEYYYPGNHFFFHEKENTEKIVEMINLEISD